MEDKYNINIRQCAMHLIGREESIAGDVTMYRYKNILWEQ